MKEIAGRVVQFVAAVAATLFYLKALEHDPQPVQVAMLVLLALALIWLYADTFSTASPAPRAFADAPPASRADARDPHTAATVRLLELHLSSKAPNRQLQMRLADLADQRLLHVHGIRRETDPAGAHDLLGPELTTVIEGPTMRLDAKRIDSALKRIEEM